MDGCAACYTRIITSVIPFIPANNLWHGSYPTVVNEAGFKQVWSDTVNIQSIEPLYWMNDILVGYNQDMGFVSFMFAFEEDSFCVLITWSRDCAIFSHFQLKDTFDFQVLPNLIFHKNKSSNMHPVQSFILALAKSWAGHKGSEGKASVGFSLLSTYSVVGSCRVQVGGCESLERGGGRGGK